MLAIRIRLFVSLSHTTGGTPIQSNKSVSLEKSTFGKSERRDLNDYEPKVKDVKKER